MINFDGENIDRSVFFLFRYGSAECGLDVLDKRTEGRWFWTDERQSKTPHPSCNRYKQIKSKSMDKIFKLQFACGLGWIEISNKSSTEAFFCCGQL